MSLQRYWPEGYWAGIDEATNSYWFSNYWPSISLGEVAEVVALLLRMKGTGRRRRRS